LREEAIHDPSNVGATHDHQRGSRAVLSKHALNTVDEQLISNRQDGDEGLDGPRPGAIAQSVGQREHVQMQA